MKQATARAPPTGAASMPCPSRASIPLILPAEKKGRTRAEVDEIFRWLTGHSQLLESELAKKTGFEDFFAYAPKMTRLAF